MAGAAKQAELLPGTLDRLILTAVSLGALHGYVVLLRIPQPNGAQPAPPFWVVPISLPPATTKADVGPTPSPGPPLKL